MPTRIWSAQREGERTPYGAPSPPTPAAQARIRRRTEEAVREDVGGGELSREKAELLSLFLLLWELHHDNIVTFYDVCYDDVTNDVTLALEYLDTDLSHLIKTPTWNSSLTKKFMYQILQGVSQLHSLNIIHRDLRPGNLLVKFQENIVKIAFGLAEKDVPVDEDYNWIGDLKYAAPEIIFGLTSYSAASTLVDMWSVGCIFAEMVMKEPLFNGDWTEMYCWFVTPEEDSGPKVTSLPVALAGKVSCLESDGFDLLSKMLCKNPAKRITTGDAIAHPYFADIVNA
ncbi:hypothetical protein LWI29_031926 [Acer saccharum]|uniref:Protein kinase domain-containing protein n=1 Tax=Acer saccharum TaxID=4024 RepID=A0AA39V3P4_ACESA|nr:hypothetical protein LWI29_031926 [Acer saccharum]